MRTVGRRASRALRAWRGGYPERTRGSAAKGSPPAPRGRGTLPARAGSRGILGSEPRRVKFPRLHEVAAVIAGLAAARAEAPFRRDAPPAAEAREVGAHAAVRAERVFVGDGAVTAGA